MRSSIRDNIILLALVVLIACIFVFGGCASRPVAEPFQANWAFVDVPGQSIKACLPEKDVAKLREILIRCEKTDCQD